MKEIRNGEANALKESSVCLKNGNPVLKIGNEELPAIAYMTYFDERNDYKAFAEKDFRIYSVSVSLSYQPINTLSGFMPYAGGVFDKKGEADFSHTDAAMKRVLDACPEAYIFPRIYVTMPKWWVNEHPDECVDVPNGQRRESLYSDVFRKDASQMLETLIKHFLECDYADHIFGYQISGGNTQEWFHLDLNGSYGQSAVKYFNRYLKSMNPDHEEIRSLPSLDAIKECEIISVPCLRAFLRFASEEVVKTVDTLCKCVKDTVNGKQITGVFYGYSQEVMDPLWGTHALKSLLKSENIDFLSSPNSYFDQRALGADWADMMPVDSVKLHGKMCFIECDVRTFLTRTPGESRPGSDPMNVYTQKVWEGPPSEELSVYAVRKSLARQLTSKHGLWWFDMFGHWYCTDALMNEMERSLFLYKSAITEKRFETDTEVCVFIDEESHSKIGKMHPAYASPFNMRKALGATGAPYDVYLISDFDEIHWDERKYKAAVFVVPHDDGYTDACMTVLREKGVGAIRVSHEKPMYTERELIGFLKDSGVFLYSESEDVFYAGNGFVSLHAKEAGEKVIRLPEMLSVTNVHNGEKQITNTIKRGFKQYETAIYRVERF